MASIETINVHGGWMIDVVTLGSPPVSRKFYAYETDKDAAVQLAKLRIPTGATETVTAVRALNVHELTGFGMKPGEVKQYI